MTLISALFFLLALITFLFMSEGILFIRKTKKTNVHSVGSLRIYFRIIFFTSLAILMAGCWSSIWLGRIADEDMREELRAKATDIAATINVDMLKKLSFTAGDQDIPEYRRLNDQFAAMVEYPDMGFRNVYTLALKPEGFLYGPNAYTEGFRGAVPPGTIYENSPHELKGVFENIRSQTAGPYTGEYGTFLSAASPVFDPVTGRVIFALGIDIKDSIRRSAVFQRQLPSFVCTVLLLAVLLTGGILVLRRAMLPAEKRWRLRYLEAYIILIMGLITTIFSARMAYELEVSHRQKIFVSLSRVITANVREDLRNIHTRLHMLAVFFQASEHVTRQEYADFTASLASEGLAYSWNWIPAVSHTEVKEFEAAARKEGIKNFFIYQRDGAGKKIPVSGREIYYPAFYCEPETSTRGEITGYDFGSDLVRRDAINTAVRTGLCTATDPVVFYYQGSRGIHVFNSVSTGGHRGVVQAMLEIGPFIMQALNRTGVGEIPVSAEIFQIEKGVSTKILFAAALGEQAEVNGRKKWAPPFSVVIPVFAFGKVYLAVLYPGRDYISSYPLKDGWIAFIAGFFLTVIAASLVAIFSTRHTFMEREVRIQTEKLRYEISVREEIEEELKRNRRQLEEAMDIAQLVNWEFDVATGVFTFDDRFYALYATTAEREGGSKMPAEVYAREFLHPEDISLVAGEVKKAIETADPDYLSQADHRIIRRDGEIRTISVRIGVVKDSSGKTVKTHGANQDITERIKAQEEKEKQLDELKRWHNVTLGREMRIIELKREINGLLAKMGKPRRYENMDAEEKG